MPISADWLLDTSAAVALIHERNPAHEELVDLTEGKTVGLAGHALFETYSVLTRLPGSARVTPSRAREIIERTFTASAPLQPDVAAHALATLTEAGVAGGAVYDGLVGLAAKSAGIPLLSCDRRAAGTYAALRVDVRLV